MTSPKMRRRRRRRAMLARRRRFTTERFGVYASPGCTITYHEIPSRCRFEAGGGRCVQPSGHGGVGHLVGS